MHSVENFQNILIFGASGQVGSNLVEIYQKKVGNLLAPDMYELDISCSNNLKEYLRNLETKPEIIINAAAYTAVDKAEEEAEQKICDNINHISVKIMAEFCAENNIPLIHYSTDYVYDGSGDKPFTEEAETKLKPLSVYGKTKLQGDKAITQSGCKHIILRTSWVYNHNGNNFVNTILRLSQEEGREELKIVSDQFGAPTYAYDLARITEKIIAKLPLLSEFPSGVYHACPSKFISWYEFAKLIVNTASDKGFDIRVKNIIPIKTEEYKTLAKRPLNSRLSTEKLSSVFGLKFPEISASVSNAISKIIK